MTHRRVAFVMLATAAIVTACAHRDVPPPAPSRSDPPRREEQREEDPVLEAKLAERDAARDYRSTIFWGRAPNPPVAARGRVVPAHGAFTTAAVATIRAYHYRHSLSSDPYFEHGETPLSQPFTRDGRLDGRVVAEAELTSSERARVLALIAEAQAAHAPASSGGHVPGRAVVRCDFDAHHVLVLFDATGAPIAKLFLALSCHQLQMLPYQHAFGGSEPGMMTDTERRTLAQILDGHGLAAWIYDEEDPMHERVRGYEARVYGTVGAYTKKGESRNATRAARPSGVAPETSAAHLTPDERLRFCLWIEGELWARARRRVNGTPFGSYECATGARYALDRETLGSCETQKLRDVPVGRLEACLRASFLDGPEQICTKGPGPVCEGLLDTLPGVDWRR